MAPRRGHGERSGPRRGRGEVPGSTGWAATAAGVPDAERAAVAAALGAFARERQWLLPALHAVQHALGWLPEWALAEAAAHLRVPPSEVFGVATHYPELRLAPRGRRHVRVCTGVSCRLRGGVELLDAIARRHGVTPGETGADRELTLEAADCFFACSMAPLVEVDGALRGRVTAADATALPAAPSTDGHGAADHGSRDGRRSAPGSTDAGSDGRGAAGAAAGSARAALTALVAAAERRRSPARLRLIVQAGTCGLSVGAGETLRELRRAVRERGLDADVVEGACNGMCWAAPVVDVQAPGGAHAAIGPVPASAVASLLDLLAGEGDLRAAGFDGVVWSQSAWRGLPPAREHPFWRGQERVLMARVGAIDPLDLDDALRAGAYAALAGALDGPAEDVIAAVKASGLQGRGGAFFPTAQKWEACRRAAGSPKYVVMNGEEGEPGIFKDRHLLEGDPHQALEGVLLAAYAAGATRAILYVHGEADVAAARLARAVADARAAGLCGESILGTAFSCDVEIRRGAGGFVLGEETALLESIEGRRAQPRTRPPFPVESGLWGRPTVINNVETLSAIPSILARGPEAVAALGTPKAPGTKVFGLSGPIARPGVVETRNGVTLRALLGEIGGGIEGGRPFLGAVVGGPSGAIVPAALFDEPMEPRGRVSPGTGGIVGVPEGASVVDIVKTLVDFNARESCGKCTPCREGLPRLLAMLDELPAAPATEPKLVELAEVIQTASLCGLGQAAPTALLRGLEAFGPAFRTRT